MKKSLLCLCLVLTLCLSCIAGPGLAQAAPVELTAVASLHSSTLDLDTLPIYQAIAEKTNVNITWEYYRADYDTKKSLILASGDLPDIFFGRFALTASDIQLNQEYFIPLEELIDQYAPNIKRMYAEYPQTAEINVFPDGHTYALPHYMPARPAHYGSSFINQAWLDKLGLKMPTTIEELTETARAFVAGDPNGNGKADEIGFAFSDFTNTNFGPRPFLGAFGVYDSIDSWRAVDGEGKVVYNPATQGYKKYLTWLNQLYAEGLMDREMLTQDFAQYKATTRRAEEEITGIQTGWEINQMNNPNYTILLPVTGPDGDQIYSGNSVMNKMGAPTYCVFAITTECKDPVAAIQWVDQFYSDEYGIQAFYGAYDVALKQNEDGTITRIAPEGQSLDSWTWTNGMNDNFVGYVSKAVEDKLVFDDAWSQKGLGKLDFDAAYAPYIDESHNYPAIILDPDVLQEATTIETDLESIHKTYGAKWISEGGIDAEWDTYLADLERAGLSRYLEIYQNAYDARK